MPDADDYDVEYLRNLMRGGDPKKGQAPPPERKPARPAAPRKKAKPAAARKRGAGR